MALGPLILDIQGTVLTDAEAQRLLHPCVGGVIFFARNIVDFEQLQHLLASVRAVRSELLLCVDQEGGRVQRCKNGFTRLPPMQVFDQLLQSDYESTLLLAEDTGWLLAAEMLSVGFDFSFAPVLDVDDAFSSVIGDRSFSADVNRVILLAEAFIKGAHQAGMAVTGKHFPGHGSVYEDSHLELPVDNRLFEDVVKRDLLPFTTLTTQLDAMMPAHIVFPAVDENPVGFSSAWLKGILRDQLGFSGVVFSDDLNMKGAAGVGGFTERAKRALDAGCDMVLACNNPVGAEEILRDLPEEFYKPGVGLRSSMRAKPYYSHSTLRDQPRWRETVAQLQAIRRD